MCGIFKYCWHAMLQKSLIILTNLSVSLIIILIVQVKLFSNLYVYIYLTIYFFKKF